MELFTPNSFVAGTRPTGRHDPAEVAWHAAAAALDTEDLRMVVSVTPGRVWFLAAPARDFASAPDCATPLAAALPGMADHRGEGTYLLPLDPLPLWAAVQFQGEQIRSFTGSFEDAKRFGDSLGLPTHEASAMTAAPWCGYQAMRLAAERAGLRVAFRWGAGLTAVGFLLWISAAAMGAIAEHRQGAASAALKARITSLTQYANQLHEQPLARTLAELQQVSQVAVQSGGAISRYQIKQGQTHWRMRLPAWVNGSAYAGLGPGVSAQPVTGGMIQVSKGGDS